jgi:hypothetical protein
MRAYYMHAYEFAKVVTHLVTPRGAPPEAAFDMLATPTPLQARALSLIGLSLASA